MTMFNGRSLESRKADEIGLEQSSTLVRTWGSLPGGRSSLSADGSRGRTRSPRNRHLLYDTLPGTNMEVENGPLEDHFPLQTGGFPLPC